MAKTNSRSAARLAARNRELLRESTYRAIAKKTLEDEPPQLIHPFESAMFVGSVSGQRMVQGRLELSIICQPAEKYEAFKLTDALGAQLLFRVEHAYPPEMFDDDEESSSEETVST